MGVILIRACSGDMYWNVPFCPATDFDPARCSH